MESKNLIRSKFTELPYDNSATCSIIIHADSAVAGDQVSIKLVNQDQSNDAGNFAFGLFPLSFASNSRCNFGYGADPKYTLDACQVLLEWDTFTIEYVANIKDPQAIAISLNVWWTNDVNVIGFLPDSDISGMVSFGKGGSKTLNNGNMVYFYTSQV